MRKCLKILSINSLILLIGVLVIELIFGSWLFRENNLDSLFIVRNRAINIELNGLYPYHKPFIEVTQDRYGFRGGLSTYNNPTAIDILCIGGSTTQQVYIEDGYTWSAILEKELKTKGIELSVANAGINGQSTFGHIKNFELWFPEIPNLKPQYIFFYVGINDFHRKEALAVSDELMRNGFLARMKGTIKDNSAIYKIVRSISGMIEADRAELTHGKVKFEEHQYVKEGLIPESQNDDFYTIGLENYERRLKLLVKYSQDLGAIPVFITQPSRRFKFDEKGEVLGIASPFKKRISGYQFNGVDYYRGMVEMNKVIKKVAASHNLLVIEQTNLSLFTDESFYDFTHTTPIGSEIIGKHIASSFIEFLDK